MPSLSTHILDAGAGGGRQGVVVELRGTDGVPVARATSDAAGRATDFAPDIPCGHYALVWRLGGGFITEVIAMVDLSEERHYHVPLLAAEASAVVYLGA